AALLRHQRREALVVAERPFDVVRTAYGVDGTVAAGDRAERRLALAKPHLVAPVDALPVGAVVALETNLAADVGDVRVGEVAHELAQRVGCPGRVRVPEGEDLALA